MLVTTKLAQAVMKFWDVSHCWNRGTEKMTVSEAFQNLREAEGIAHNRQHHKMMRKISGLKNEIVQLQSPNSRASNDQQKTIENF